MLRRMLAAALLTALLALATFGTLLAFLSRQEGLALPALCLVATLPMSWLMFHGLRLPLDAWLKLHLGKSELLWWLQMAYAPLTEEPAKLWPLLLPPVRRAITAQNLGRFALALGLGFAIGEIFMIAGLVIAHQPKVAALPWYQLGGFITERLMTCVIHPAMTALALVGWRRGPGFLSGLLAAMAAHFLVNFPIGAVQRGWLGSKKVFLQAFLSVWVLLCAAAAVPWLAWLLTGQRNLSQLLYGRADCPECGREYVRGVLTGLNAGASRRYERCPHCRKWHWTEAKSKALWIHPA
jgi:hypothetical protein